MNKLVKKIEAMQSPLEGRKYCAITLTASEDGKFEWRAQSCFAGMTETEPPRELRTTCEVIPDKMLSIWRDLGQPYVVVNSNDDLVIFLMIGGNGLLDINIAKEKLPFAMETWPVARDGLLGTIILSQVPEAHLQRAPTPKERMKVLKRDDYRCRICGRRSVDYVDVELNVHHVHPWGIGGLSNEENLITLCRTCHQGLDPHSEMKLFELMPSPEELNIDVEQTRRELFAGIKRYRKQVFKQANLMQTPKISPNCRKLKS